MKNLKNRFIKDQHRELNDLCSLFHIHMSNSLADPVKIAHQENAQPKQEHLLHEASTQHDDYIDINNNYNILLNYLQHAEIKHQDEHIKHLKCIHLSTLRSLKLRNNKTINNQSNDIVRLNTELRVLKKENIDLKMN